MSTASWLAISPAAAPPIPSHTANSEPCGPTTSDRFASRRPRALRVRSATRKLSSLCSRIWPTSVRAKSFTRISPPAALDSFCVTGAGSPWSCVRSVEIEPKKLLADTEMVSVLQADLLTELQIRSIGRAQVDQRKTARALGAGSDAPLNDDRGVTAGKKRVFREYQIADFTADDRLGFLQVVHVAYHPLHSALAETGIARRGRRAEEERSVVGRHTEPLLCVLHNLKLYHLLSCQEQVLIDDCLLERRRP